VIDLPGDHPPPHPELPGQHPLIFTVPAGGILFRHHQKIHDPVHFGKTGVYRFDDPECPKPGCFGVLYTGADPECCLLESCGSMTGVPAVSLTYLDARAIAILELLEPLRFIDLVSDGGLASIGADARLTTGSYIIAQRWSAALRRHSCQPDGIRYRSRHAPERIAYAMYERPRGSFSAGSMGSFTDPANEALFRSILKTYNFALI
jgi:hypothetical protein